MQKIQKLELLELSELLVDTNREFTYALRKKRPYDELAEIYLKIQQIYRQIQFLKEQRMEVV